MKILLCSHVFPPQIGGIEIVGALLAEQWSRLGAVVTVVTQTPGGRTSAEYEIVRRPSLSRLCKLANKSDLVFQNNISLRTLMPLLPLRKPIVIAHHGMLDRGNGKRGWQERIKCAMLPFCRNIAISNAVAQALPVKSTIIHDPFEPGEFAHHEAGERSRDIVFLGRLVSDKGCELVLRALAILRRDGICPSFTVIGDGPEMPALRRMTAELALSDQVTFTGAMGAGRGREIARHKVMVIPSDWEEPFGVVALEGLAAGCALAASRAGGLPEAVGPCGLLFPRGDAGALAGALKELLASPSLRQKLISRSPRHLQEFRPETVAKRYLEFFEAVLARQIAGKRRASA